MVNEEIQEDPSFGEASEVQLSCAYTLGILLTLIAILVSNKVAHHYHWHCLPEAAAIILVGVAAGIVCRLFPGNISEWLVVFDTHTFFVMLLPPIIFTGGYTMKRRFFFENIRGIIFFAIFGTFISTIFVGCSLFYVGKYGFTKEFSIAESMTFGALISATDPVSTLAVFQELHVDPMLFYLVFGESVLNDAVAIVLFSTFSKFIGLPFSLDSAIFALIDFALIFIGSTLVGVLFGLLSSILFKYFNFKGCLLHEVAVYVMFSYLPFLASMAVDMSGVVSVLFTGMTMKHYTVNNITPEAQDMCGRMFSSIAHLTETVIFLNLGLSVFSLTEIHASLILWSLLFILVGRAIHVYPLSAILNRTAKDKINKNKQHMLWYSGLRGAVAFALATSFPGKHKDDVIATTMIIVLITVFLMGGGTVAMLDRLQIERLTPEQELELNRSVRPIDRMRLLQLDRQYLVPFFTRKTFNKIFMSDATIELPPDSNTKDTHRKKSKDDPNHESSDEEITVSLGTITST